MKSLTKLSFMLIGLVFMLTLSLPIKAEVVTKDKINKVMVSSEIAAHVANAPIQITDSKPVLLICGYAGLNIHLIALELSKTLENTLIVINLDKRDDVKHLTNYIKEDIAFQIKNYNTYSEHYAINVDIYRESENYKNYPKTVNSRKPDNRAIIGKIQELNEKQFYRYSLLKC